MRSRVNHPLTIIAIFIWVGAVFAISFLEAWLKFQAPGVTIAIGLGIGKLVFAALNNFQWILAIVVVASFSFGKSKFSEIENLLVYFVIGLLLLQTFWLLPSLDQRASLVIAGKNLGASNLHIYFIVVEILKVLALMTAGILNFKRER
ncbi:uncharacterized membrane protein (DUF485 family) [Pedobacter sp. UYP30]|uniref:hypothetical protein n=1 Tax=Pedobacter sp. UYP30 TaxID=1756400 RepID=UPI003392C6A4